MPDVSTISITPRSFFPRSSIFVIPSYYRMLLLTREKLGERERVMRTSEQKVFLILDNLKVHHGKLAAAWLEKNKEKMEVSLRTGIQP